MNEIEKKLYLLFSDKTLSEGCIIEDWESYWRMLYIYWRWCYYLSKDFQTRCYINKDWYDRKILWHEPQLHDVFKKAESNSWTWIANSDNWISFADGWCNLWNWIEYNHYTSLMNQSDSTKQEIINLFK